jgi:hypothetical protein
MKVVIKGPIVRLLPYNIVREFGPSSQYIFSVVLLCRLKRNGAQICSTFIDLHKQEAVWESYEAIGICVNIEHKRSKAVLGSFKRSYTYMYIKYTRRASRMKRVLSGDGHITHK